MNRNHGKVFIVDSAGLWITADSSSTGSFLDYEFQTATFVSSASGDLEITAESNTAANTVIRILATASDFNPSVTWPKNLSTEERLFVKTCLNGTGFLYFS